MYRMLSNGQLCESRHHRVTSLHSHTSNKAAILHLHTVACYFYKLPPLVLPGPTIYLTPLLFSKKSNGYIKMRMNCKGKALCTRTSKCHSTSSPSTHLKKIIAHKLL